MIDDRNTQPEAAPKRLSCALIFIIALVLLGTCLAMILIAVIVTAVLVLLNPSFGNVFSNIVTGL